MIHSWAFMVIHVKKKSRFEPICAFRGCFFPPQNANSQYFLTIYQQNPLIYWISPHKFLFLHSIYRTIKPLYIIMKKSRITVLLIILMSMVCYDLYAYNIAIPNNDGVTIYYNWMNNQTELQVTYQYYSSYKYYGYENITSISIPKTVIYNEKEYQVTSIGENALRGNSGLTSVTIPNSVTSIGDYAFQNCSGLTSITIPNSVTSIGDYAFSGCSNLPIENNIRYADTYLIQAVDKTLSKYIIKEGTRFIGKSAFYGCPGLTSITIPHSVTSIGENAFCECSGLTSITIPNSVTNIESFAFLYCSSLTTISIGNGVKSIGENAFAQCSVLTDVYCKAEELSSTENEESGPLYTYASAFENSSIEAATLHVPESAINAYKNTEPWSGFGTFVTLSSEEMKTPKCATPTISYQNEKLTFSCATEDVSYHYDITASSIKSGSGNNIDLTPKYIITVYATKDGYEDSEIEKLEVSIGDANCDGIINAADIVTIAGIIIKGSESELK